MLELANRAALVALPNAGRSQHIRLANQHRQHAISAQVVVVVEIFVTQRNTKHALCDQVAHGVFDTLLNPVIPEALTDTIQQADPLIDLAQQQSTTVRSEPSAVEPVRLSDVAQDREIQADQEYTLCP